MYSIKINEQILDLPINSSVSLTITNPHFIYESVDGKKGNVPKLPWTLNNQRAFNFAELPQLADNSNTRFACTHEYNGRILHEGVFLLTRAGKKDGYSGVYVENVGEFFGDIQSELLSNIPFKFTNTPTTSDGFVYYDGVQKAFCYPTIINSDYFGTNPGSYSGKMNDFNLPYGKTSPRVPMFFANYILSRIEDLTGKKIVGDVLNDELFQNLIIYNTREQTTDLPIISQHLPDIPLSRHLIELYRKMFNLGIEFQLDSGSLKFVHIDGIFGDNNILDWTDKATDTETKILENAPRIVLGMTLDSGDAMVKDKPSALQDYYSDLDTSKGITSIKTQYSTLLTDETSGLATTKQQGITETNSQLTNKFSPRVLIWNGVNNGIPKATAISGNMGLYWQNLVLFFWKNTIENRSKRFFVEKGVVLSEGDIALIDMSKKIYINGTLFYLVSANISLPADKEVKVLLASA